MLTVLLSQIITTCSARWYTAVRPIYDLSNKTLTLYRIQRTPKRIRESLRYCRKDKHCGKGRFCYKQLGSCHLCRWGGQLCKRNNMCCKGYVCLSGFCTPFKQFGAEGAFCRKTKDCQRGLCCAKSTAGPKVCRKYLREGDACSLTDNSPFRISNYCMCGSGLKCKKVRRISSRIRGNPGWLQRRERRCAKA